MKRDYEYIVLGSRRLRQRGGVLALQAGRRRGAWAWSSSSWGMCGGSRRTIRASSGSRITPRRTSSSPSTPFAPGPSWRRMRASRSCSRPVDSTFAPRVSAIPLTNYSGSMDAAGVGLRGARRRRDHAPLAALPTDRRHPRTLPARERDRDGGPGQRRPPAGGPGARRHPAGSLRRWRRSGRGMARSRSTPGESVPLPAAGHRGRLLVQPGAGPIRDPATAARSPRSR